MLDIIRKKASAWGVKIIFGIIIVVFIFFFGYSRMSKDRGGAKYVVARVNDTAITRPEFQMAYDNAQKMYQNIFKAQEGGELPEGIEKSIRGSALNQLIQQAAIKQVGDKIGVEPTSFELADTIKRSPVAANERGEFDPILYKQRFLPYFAQKYSMDYEDVVKQDMTVQRVNEIFGLAKDAPDARELFNVERTKFTFGVQEFANEADAKANKNGKAVKTDPVTVRDREKIITGDIGISSWEKIFSLKPNTGLSEPVKSGDKWYMVKLVKVMKPTDAEWAKERQGFEADLTDRTGREIFQTWISAYLKDAKIKTFIEQ